MASETLPPYNASATCPKCRGDDVSTEHKAANEYRLTYKGPQCEHIHRVCRRCHYRWNEAPLDAEEMTDGG